MSGPYRSRKGVTAMLETIRPHVAHTEGVLTEALAFLRDMRAAIQRGHYDIHLIEIASDLEAKLDEVQRYDAKRRVWLQTLVGLAFTAAGVVGAVAALVKDVDPVGIAGICLALLLAALRAGTKLAFHEQRGRLAASLAETIQLARARYDRVSDRLPPEVSTAPDEARTGVRADVAGAANQSNDDASEVDEEAAPKAKKKHG